MAAGLGFKTFTTGEVLTAADVNGYLMQGVLVFASEAARDAAITSPQEGQFAFTKDNNSLWYYSGAAWVASGATGDIEGVTAGTGISGGGTSGTVTITNSMATEIDAKGDLVVGTGADTFARLAVGTDGYTLVADSVETTGLKWAAPAGGGGSLVFISSLALTSTTQSLNNCFTSTYDNYLINLRIDSATTNAAISLRFRASGVDTSTSYDVDGDNNATLTTQLFIVSSANSTGYANINVASPNLAARTAGNVLAMGINVGVGVDGARNNYTQDSLTQFDGFTIFSTATLTGTARVYGYANS